MESDRHIDIYKAAGILIKDRRILVSRSKGKRLYINPGGKVNAGESVKEALVRELMEESKISVNEKDLDEFGTFYAPAAEQEDRWLRMDVFIVKQWHGEPTPDNEIEDSQWVTSVLGPGMAIGSILEHEIIPRLKAANLID